MVKDKMAYLNIIFSSVYVATINKQEHVTLFKVISP
jgi:hypothetical protein